VREKEKVNDVATEPAKTDEGTIEVSAKLGKAADGPSATVSYVFGGDLAAAEAKFGADVVLSNAVANMKVTLQSIIRRMLKAGNNAADIQKAVASWVPGVAIARAAVNPIEAIKAKFRGASPADRMKLIAELQEIADGE